MSIGNRAALCTLRSDSLVEPSHLVGDEFRGNESGLADALNDLLGLLLLACELGLNVAAVEGGVDQSVSSPSHRRLSPLGAHFAFGIVGVPVPLPLLLPWTPRRAFLTPARLASGDGVDDGAAASGASGS